MNPVRRFFAPLRLDAASMARALDSLSLLACATGAADLVEPPLPRRVAPLMVAPQPEVLAEPALSFGE
jgi:hypothetical protein